MSKTATFNKSLALSIGALAHDRLKLNTEELTITRNIGSDYQEIQIRTLTKWVNAQLRQVSDSIADITTDLRDGTKLLKLLSVVAGDAPKPERMNMRIHQLANVAQALYFLERSDIGNEAIVNGDVKKTLALISFIMIKYQIQLVLSDHGPDYLQSLSKLCEQENGIVIDYTIHLPPVADKLTVMMEAKSALLYWIHIQLDDYITANIIPTIQDFSRSWTSGVAFCLLIHTHNSTYVPGLFTNHLNTHDKYHLLQVAFDLASQHMGIEKYIEPKDLLDVEYPHEPTVMMYISEFYKVMSAYQRQESAADKKARAAKRKAAIVLASIGNTGCKDAIEEKPVQENIAEPKEAKKDTPLLSNKLVRKPSTVSRPLTQQHLQEEKAKIKKDLKMQLTGHLTKGVHPLLDTLLTIHDTVLAYIKWNTQKIDEIPMEFDDSFSVSKYLDLMESMQEQASKEAAHLNAAKNVRERLTSEDTVLTQLQQYQVIKMYTAIETEWNHFVELIKSTKQELSTVRDTLAQIEKDAQDYEAHTKTIENELDTLLEQLSQIESSRKSQLDAFSAELDSFEKNNWRDFIQHSNRLSKAFIPNTNVQEKHASLISGLAERQSMRENLERSRDVARKVETLETELEEIQCMKATPENMQALEFKLSHARSIMYSIQQDYGDLDLTILLSDIQEKYEMVSDYIDQIRVWFLEAERVQSWIEQQTTTINQRNAGMGIDPLDQHFEWKNWSAKDIDTLYNEHEVLRRDIQRFNEQDMKRLRLHVRQVMDQHLSPSDAATIETTLSTLNSLDRMNRVLQKRTDTINLLKLRVQWETLFEKAMDWINTKDKTITDLVVHKARWSESSSKKMADKIAQTLVGLENQISRFNTDEYACILEIYQEMESINVNLPQHLEQRQEELESRFECIVKKCEFLRLVVEQFLAVTQVMEQFNRKKLDGNKLISILKNQTSSAFDQSFNESVYIFKDDALQWVTTWMKAVSYPEASKELEDLKKINEQANQEISNHLNICAMKLAKTTVKLENLLLTSQQSISLQRRAELVYENLMHATTWIQEHLRLIQKYDLSSFEQDITQLELTRLEKDFESINSKREYLETHHIKHVLESVYVIEKEIDGLGNHASLDRKTLSSGAQKLKNLQETLKQVLTIRKKEINVLKKQIAWKTQCSNLQSNIDQSLRIFNDLGVEFVNSQVNQLQEELDSSDQLCNDLHVKLSLEYQNVKTNFASVTNLFKEFKDAYDDFNKARHSTNAKDVPDHIKSMQARIEEKYQNVHMVYNLIENTLTQHNATIALVHETENLQSKAEPILKAVVQLKRKISASLASKTINEENVSSYLQLDSQIQVIDQLRMIMTEINVAYKKGLSIQFMSTDNCTDPVLSQTLANLEHFHGQISRLVAKRLNILTSLKESVEFYLDFYSQMYTISASTMEYSAKLAETGNILDKILQQIHIENFDVADALVILTPELVSRLRSKIDDLVKEFTQLKTTRLANFQHQQTQFCDISFKSIELNIQRCCDSWYASLEQKLVLVEDLLETQTVIVEIAEKRLIWELQLQENETQLGLLNDLVSQYGLNIEKNVALGTIQLDLLVKQHFEITKQIEHFLKTEVLSMKSDFESMEQSFRKHHLLPSTPLYMQDKMYFFNVLLERLSAGLSSQSQVLDYLRQKLDLEDQIKGSVLDLEYQKSEIAAFIQQRGKWYSNNEEESTAESDTQLDVAKGRFETYQKTVLKDIQTSYTSLKKTSSSLDSEIIRNAGIVNFAYLMQMEAHVEADIAFAKEVLQLKKRVNKFVDQATILEKEAEYISEILLSRSPSKSLLSAHEQKVNNFKMKISNLEAALKDDIHFPKRSNQNDNTMTMQISDKIMASSVGKFIHARISRLNEAGQGLSRLLVAQESRVKYTLQLFIQQTDICQSWISSMCSTLERNVLKASDSSKEINQVIEAAVTAEGIHALMNSHDNNFTLLCKYKEKYTQLNVSRSCEYTSVCENFEKVKLKWSDLLAETKEVSQALFSSILPMNLHCRANDLVSSCKKLINDMESTDKNSITSECFFNWQTRIYTLEFQGHKKLSNEVMHDTTAYMEESLVTKLKQAGDFILEARAIQGNLYHSINASRVRSTYADNLELFQNIAANIASLVDGSKFSKKTPEKHAELSSVHAQIKNKYLECHYLYLDLCCPVEPETQATQTNLETMWRTVQNKHAEFTNDNLADLKWVHGCQQVDEISESLKALKNMVDTVAGATAAKEEIQKVEKQISKYFSSLEHTEISARNDTFLDYDKEKRCQFLSQIRDTRKIGIECQQKVDLCKLEKSKQALLDAFNLNIAKNLKICKDQLAFIQQQATFKFDLKKPDNVNRISTTYSTALSHIQVKKRECENVYISIIMDQADELVNVYGYSSTEIYASTSRLDQLLKDLGQKLDIEIDYTTSLHQLRSLTQYQNAINSVIMELKSAICRTGTMDENAEIDLQSFDVSKVNNFESKHDSTGRSIEEFYKKCNTFKGSIGKNIGLQRQCEIINALSAREESLKKLWAEIEDGKEETLERLKVHQKHHLFALQLSKSLGYARYLQDRIKTYQLSSVWRTTTLEDQELDEITNEINDNFAQLPVDSTVLDEAHTVLDLQHQKQKLNLKVKELHQSNLHCRAQAQKERNITEFYTALERIDTEMFLILKFLADTSLTNSKIVDLTFEEDGLRKILDTLLLTFEERSKVMEQLLEEIDSKGNDINDEEITCVLNQTMTNWSLLKYSILSREQDLQSCIQQLDHEFYTRLALADLSVNN